MGGIGKWGLVVVEVEEWMSELEGIKGVEAEKFTYSSFLQHIWYCHIEVHSFGRRLQPQSREQARTYAF